MTSVDFDPAGATPEAPAPAPTEASDTDIAPARRCVINDDCVIVWGHCDTTHGANREHAAEEQARLNPIDLPSECMGHLLGEHPAVVEPMCDAHECGLREAPDPEARWCQDDADCEAVPMGCTWAIVSRTAPGYARVVAVSEGFRAGAAPPCVIPDPPTLRCVGYCARARDLYLPDDEDP
jgi:hypothetical protein